MFPFLLALSGLGLGFVVGRWWALLPALAIGLWAGLTDASGIPGLAVGLYIGLPAALGILLGVMFRRALARRRTAARA